jgi:two-component system NtrC family sensor kinase
MTDSHAAAAIAPQPENAMTSPPIRRMLVVDDEPDIRETLAEILEHYGFLVDIAASGHEALALTRANSYDGVLSDIRMPGLNGMELYRQLALHKPELTDRFVVVTGDDLSGSVRAFLDETRVPVIEKPFGPADVRRVLRDKFGPA